MNFHNRRNFIPAALALATFVASPYSSAQTHQPTITAAPGTLVRWSAPGTLHCSMRAHIWPALQGVCYYPIDLLTRTETITIARWGTGPKHLARISVEPNDYGTEEITLPDIPRPTPRQKT